MADTLQDTPTDEALEAIAAFREHEAAHGDVKRLASGYWKPGAGADAVLRRLAKARTRLDQALERLTAG